MFPFFPHFFLKFIYLYSLNYQMSRIKKNEFLAIIGLLFGLFSNVALAQTGQRYAEPVFDEVNIETGIPFSSAIKEGDTSPTT